MKREADGAIITQYEMNGVAKLGLLKMDFLGLRNLTVLDDTLVHLRAKGLDLDLEAAHRRPGHLRDAPGRRLRQRLPDGVGGHAAAAAELRPDRFEDIVALIALYRPGPMEEIPSTSRASATPAGQAPAPADGRDHRRHPRGAGLPGADHHPAAEGRRLLRRRGGPGPQGHRQEDRVADAQGGAALPGRLPREGPQRRPGSYLWRLIQPFAGYSFNRAHAAGYGLVAWQTAYLKAHHPVEYMAALLCSVKDDKDARPKYLGSCRRMGITVLPPDVNDSDSDFTSADGKAIRYGLSGAERR